MNCGLFKILFLLLIPVAALPLYMGNTAAMLPDTELNKTTVLSSPMRFCFYQYEGNDDLTKTTLSYKFLVAASDHYKEGDVFVGFRQRSVPGVLWLKNGCNGVKYDGTLQTPSYKLQPLISLNIIPQPTDVSAFYEDGEVLVGYGLRTKAGATATDSFQEMVDNDRFSIIWVVGGKETAAIGFA